MVKAGTGERGLLSGALVRTTPRRLLWTNQGKDPQEAGALSATRPLPPVTIPVDATAPHAPDALHQIESNTSNHSRKLSTRHIGVTTLKHVLARTHCSAYAPARHLPANARLAPPLPTPTASPRPQTLLPSTHLTRCSRLGADVTFCSASVTLRTQAPWVSPASVAQAKAPTRAVAVDSSEVPGISGHVAVGGRGRGGCGFSVG